MGQVVEWQVFQRRKYSWRNVHETLTKAIEKFTFAISFQKWKNGAFIRNFMQY